MTVRTPFRLGQSLAGSPKAVMRANTCCGRAGLWLAREQRLLFCRALDGIVDIGDGEPLISLPRLAHMPNAGKGNENYVYNTYC